MVSEVYSFMTKTKKKKKKYMFIILNEKIRGVFFHCAHARVEILTLWRSLFNVVNYEFNVLIY